MKQDRFMSKGTLVVDFRIGLNSLSQVDWHSVLNQRAKSLILRPHLAGVGSHISLFVTNIWPSFCLHLLPGLVRRGVPSFFV